MNKTAKFGYEMLGLYVTVKLNVGLTKSNLEELERNYKEWLCFMPGYKKLTRIEGVLPYKSRHKFIEDLELAKLRSKIEKLKEKESDILNMQMNIDPPAYIYTPTLDFI
jgi:hypothetical protein